MASIKLNNRSRSCIKERIGVKTRKEPRANLKKGAE